MLLRKSEVIAQRLHKNIFDISTCNVSTNRCLP